MPSTLISTVPLAALAAVTVRGSPLASLSLPSTLMVTGVSSDVLAVSATATGGELTGTPAPTVTATVLLALPPWPSLML